MTSQVDLPVKKRRLRGACDICKHQKTRCDSAVQPGGRCSNCVAFNSECTHSAAPSKGPRRQRTKVHSVEGNSANTNLDSPTGPNDSIRAVKDVVNGLLDQSYIAPQDRDALLELLLEISRYARSLEQELSAYRQSTSGRTASTSVSPKLDSREASSDDAGEVIDMQKLPEHFKRITTDTSNRRFFGKNSCLLFVRAAMEARLKDTAKSSFPSSTRPVYWTPLPWEVHHPEPVASQTFPPAELLRDLVDIYFKEINIFWFILHRPTFEDSIARGLHLRDPAFGSVVLAVCALASKNSYDKRVLLPCEQGELSAGWEWFRQIRRPFSGRVVKTASLYELQLCGLYILFQQTSFDLESCWLVCGTGILQARDIGLDRLVGKPFTVEDELFRRSFFFLWGFDSIASACFGRPRVSIPGAELNLATACDDEYWEQPDPAMSFKQPPGKPALSEYFNAFINLVKIFTFEWRTSGPPLDYTGTRLLEPEIVAELDSRLDQWSKEIPEHLLWNPYHENETFFEQSVALHAFYYHLQIMVHRPFLQTKSASTLRSLAICTNAARSCATVADVKIRRGVMPNPQLVARIACAVFDSAIVLLLTISGGTRSGLALDIAVELADVYKCMTLLHQAERRWQTAGRFYDCLCEILNASNFPLPPPSSPDVTPLKLSYETSYERKDPAETNVGDLESWPDSFLTLPMAVDDLGNLPIYGSLEKSVDFADVGPLPTYNFSGIPQLSQDMDTDHYLSRWIPYFSMVDEVAQGIQGITSSVET
ncbi:Fungal-trans domain-containing protein [Mycena sanguinolenta]|uniref:Fungal-trans domain-containing protein n=1 Tax=Mycena sanguinolenta TaxID=230812 RepID=A0A8H6YTZ4_9AGAR|nr:Fungal-trans domain-containing protein [Mycena sanguinolenta]